MTEPNLSSSDICREDLVKEMPFLHSGRRRFLFREAWLNQRDSGGHTPLHWAAAFGDLQAVRRLLHLGASANGKSRERWTPLHFAAWYGRSRASRMLLAHGARVNARDDLGQTSLDFAVSWAHFALAADLIAHGAKANACHWAAMGRLRELRTLLDSNPKAVQARLAQGESPLHLAIRFGHNAVARHLLSGGAEMECRDKQGRTPLHWAALGGLARGASLLIRHGADVNTHDHEGDSPLHYAAACGENRAAEILKLESLLDSEIDRSETPRFPIWTPELIFRYSQTAEILIDGGADPEMRCGHGESPLHRAAWAGAHGMVRVLLDRAPNPNAATRYGWTPLHIACLRADVATAKALLEKGANPNLQARAHRDWFPMADKPDFCGTALHLAFRCGPPRLVCLLRAHGADPLIRDERGRLPSEGNGRRRRRKPAEGL